MKENHFDLAAAEWDQAPTRRQIVEKAAEYIRKSDLLHEDKRVLDFGTGTGLLAVSVHDRVGAVIALDSSEGMLEQLHQKIESHKIKNIRTEFLDIEGDTSTFVANHEGSFDLIISSMVLHHIADLPALFDLFGRICKPHARLALADLDREDGTFHPDNDEAGVKHFGFDRDELKKIILQSGWREVRFETVHTVVREESGKKYPVFICVAGR